MYSVLFNTDLILFKLYCQAFYIHSDMLFDGDIYSNKY